MKNKKSKKGDDTSENKSDLEECTGQKNKGKKRKDDTDSSDSSEVGLGN